MTEKLNKYLSEITISIAGAVDTDKLESLVLKDDSVLSLDWWTDDIGVRMSVKLSKKYASSKCYLDTIKAGIKECVKTTIESCESFDGVVSKVAVKIDLIVSIERSNLVAC